MKLKTSSIPEKRRGRGEKRRSASRRLLLSFVSNRLTLILQRRALPDPNTVFPILDLNTTPLISLPLVPGKHRPPSFQRSSSRNLSPVQPVRRRSPSPLLALPSRASPLMSRPLVLHGKTSSPVSGLRSLPTPGLTPRKGWELFSRRCDWSGRSGGRSQGLRSRRDAETEARGCWRGNGWSNERSGGGLGRDWRRRFRIEPGSKVTTSVGETNSAKFKRRLVYRATKETEARRERKTRERERTNSTASSPAVDLRSLLEPTTWMMVSV